MILLQQKSEKILRNKGIEGATRPVPLKFAVPLLEAAAYEENEDLHDYWARLLANAMDPNNEQKMRQALISIFKDMESIDAHIIKYFYENAVASNNDPKNWTPSISLIAKYFEIEVDDCESSIRNLVRLGCIKAQFNTGEGYLDKDNDYVSVDINEEFSLTHLGETLIHACLIEDD